MTTFEVLAQESHHPGLFGSNESVEMPSPIALTPPAYELAQLLSKLGAMSEPADLPPSIDRTPLTELRRKGVIKTVGGARGRPGRIELLIELDHLVLSARRRLANQQHAAPAQNQAPTLKPTVEELRALLEQIDAIEHEMHARRSHEIELSIATLKRNLLDAKSGSDEEQTLFETLRERMEQARSLEGEIRRESLAQIEQEKGQLAAFVPWISRERGT